MRDAEFRDRIAAAVERELGAAQAKRALVRYESIWYSGDARTTTVQKVADELVREFRRSPGSERTRNSERKSCGFAISTYNQDMIEGNAIERAREDVGRERVGGESLALDKFVTRKGEITKAGWEQLNEDIRKIERNALGWLRKQFLDARDEGHDRYDDLIGSVFYDPDDKEQMELLEWASPEGRNNSWELTSGKLGEAAFVGVSSFGSSVLGGAITFFDCDEEF